MDPTNKAPTSKASDKVDLGYDPQGSGQEHDAFFASVAPGTANSGNLAHQWSIEGDHSNSSEPASDMKGE